MKKKVVPLKEGLECRATGRLKIGIGANGKE